MARIHEQIPKIMADVEPVAKERTNPQQGYKFRGIDDMYSALQAVLAKHQVFYTVEVENVQRDERESKNGTVLYVTLLTIKYTFYGDDGSNVYCRTVGEAMDSGDKSCNKAMSTALKYCLMQLFCIPTDDPKDTENVTHELSPRANNTVVNKTAVDSGSQSGDIAVCPQCGSNALRPGKPEWGGGYYCNKRIGGCGAKISELPETKKKVGAAEWIGLKQIGKANGYAEAFIKNYIQFERQKGLADEQIYVDGLIRFSQPEKKEMTEDDAERIFGGKSIKPDKPDTASILDPEEIPF